MNGNRKRMVSLAQICTLNMGQSPSSESYNVKKDGLPFFQGNADFGDLYPVERVWCNKPTKIAHKGDILLSVRAPIGAVNLAKGDCCIGRGLAALSPIPSQCRMMYLYYALKSKVKILKQQGTGTTFKAVGKDNISALQIPLYDLEEQKQIIGKLTCIDAGIDNAHKQIAKLDTLVKSRFVEMFGDPVTNPMGWKIKQLQDIVTEDCTISYGIVQTGDPQKEGIPVFRPVDIVGNSVPHIEELKKTTKEISDRYKRTILHGDELLITVRANIADTCIIGNEFAGCNVGRGITPLRFNPEIANKVFLKAQIDNQGINAALKELAKGITLIQLNMEDLRRFPLIIPPIELQNQFAEFVELADKSKLAIHKLLEKQELLRAALMQEYFG